MADPKPARRIRDPQLLRTLHIRWRHCALCGERGPLSLHHVHKHPRDDVEANLVMLCGSGTTGCHGNIEHAEPGTCAGLERHIRVHRPDVCEYLRHKLGSAIAADDWLRRLGRRGASV